MLPTNDDKPKAVPIDLHIADPRELFAAMVNAKNAMHQADAIGSSTDDPDELRGAIMGMRNAAGLLIIQIANMTGTPEARREIERWKKAALN
jgi:hypothetical protein